MPTLQLSISMRAIPKREDVRSVAGFSIYEGRTFIGKVLHTLVRGRLVVKDGETIDTRNWDGPLCQAKSGQVRESKFSTTETTGGTFLPSAMSAS
jgi:hypothetical protein